MSLSKYVYQMLGSYMEQLHYHPIRTKSISSCVIALSGNVVSQYMSGAKVLNQDSLIAFGLFGLIFGGTVPHFFYQLLDRVLTEETSNLYMKQLLIERLIYTPLFQALALYMLARLEGRSQKESKQQLLRLYWPVLKANWIWLTVLQYLNLRVVPPMLRVLVVNLIGFFWCIFLANKRRKVQEARDKRQ
ncbi:peroxisomal membrane protein 2 [Anabrus simplex]|uniref:peroxisomal membrane protein 2 n=1 Tax=Anabrus simplex TaxID=316456 RepID=UPI0034DD8648